MEKHSIQAHQEFSEERFTKRIIYNTGETTAFILNFNPGQQLPNHKHPGSEVYLYVVSGNGTFIVDGQETGVTTGDIVHVGGSEEMAFRNSGSESCSLYVVLSKIPNENYAKNI